MCSVISKSSSFGPDRSEIKRCKWKDRIIDESESELFDQLLFFHFFLVFLKNRGLFLLVTEPIYMNPH